MKNKKLIILLLLIMIFPFITKSASLQGDVNGDNKVNTSDYVKIRKHILSNPTLSGAELTRADVNSDGKVNTADYIKIRKIILGIDTSTSPTATPTATANVTATPTASNSTSGVSRIHFIHTGPSDAILIESNGQYGLVDSSNPYVDNTKQAMESKVESVEHVKNYLTSLGVKKLSFVIGTHAHSDHVGGMRVIAQNFVDSNTKYYYRTYQGTTEDTTLPSWDNQGYYSRAKSEMSKYGATLVEVSGKSPSFKLGDFTVQIKHTGAFHKTRENNNSIVTYIYYKNKKHKTLLTADLELYDEQSVANDVGKIEVLKVGHHGNPTGTSINFVNTLKPKIAVITHNYVTPKLYPVVYHMQQELKTKVYLTQAATDAVVVNYTDDKVAAYNSPSCTKAATKVGNFSLGQASGDWRKINGTWALIQDGKVSHDKWYQSSGGSWYHVDALGNFLTGWNKVTWGSTKSCYYFDLSSGSMYTGEKTINGKKAVFSNSGACTSGCGC